MTAEERTLFNRYPEGLTRIISSRVERLQKELIDKASELAQAQILLTELETNLPQALIEQQWKQHHTHRPTTNRHSNSTPDLLPTTHK